jgi:hypothetical protein
MAPPENVTQRGKKSYEIDLLSQPEQLLFSVGKCGGLPLSGSTATNESRFGWGALKRLRIRYLHLREVPFEPRQKIAVRAGRLGWNGLTTNTSPLGGLGKPKGVARETCELESALANWAILRGALQLRLINATALRY